MTIAMIVSLACIGISIYGSIIGVYILVIKHMRNTSEQLGRIYVLINTHLQDSAIHPEKESVVTLSVCHEVQKRHESLLENMMSKVTEIGADVKDLIKAGA